MHNNNAAQWLIDRNIEQGYGEAIAVRFRRTTRSYADVMRATWRVQNTLRDLGVREGERVVVLANDGPDLVAWFLGCLRAGVIAVPVSPLLSGEQVGDVAREAGATLLVVSAPFRFFIDAAARRTPSLFQAVVIDDAGRLATSTIGGPTVVSWSDYGDDSPAPVSAVTSDGAAFHFYPSSGSKTPEAPTRVVATHARIHSQATKYVHILDHLSATDRVYGLPKLHMPVGIECSLIVPFCFGAAVVLEPGRSASARGLCEAVASEAATVFFLDSATARNIVEGDVERATLSSLHTVVLVDDGDDGIAQRFSDRFGPRVVQAPSDPT